MDRLLVDAPSHQQQDTAPVRALAQVRRLQRLEERGAEEIEQDQQGRSVYLRCEAEYRNKPGSFEVREDGVAFSGEVLVEIPWTNVTHVARTEHSYQGLDYYAVAIQERKRRTATTFVFPDDSIGKFGRELTVKVWEQVKTK